MSRRVFITNTGVVVGGFSVGAGLLGCGDETSSGSGAAKDPKAALKGKVIGKPADSVQEVETVETNAANGAAKEFGMKVRVSNANNDAAKQRTQFDQFVSQGVAGILLTAITMDGWETPIKDAVDRNVFVMNLSGGPITGASMNFTQDHGKGGEEVGKIVGRWIREKHNGEGIVGVLTALSAPIYKPRTDEAMRVIREMNPNVTFAPPVNSGTAELGAKGGANLIQAHPDMIAMLNINDDSAIGAMQALREAGKTDPEKFHVSGFDATPKGQELIKENSVFQLSWSFGIPYWIVQAVRWIADDAMGKSVPPTARARGVAVTKQNLTEYQKWGNDALASQNQGRFKEIIDTSEIAVKTGEPVGKAFE